MDLQYLLEKIILRYVTFSQEVPTTTVQVPTSTQPKMTTVAGTPTNESNSFPTKVVVNLILAILAWALSYCFITTKQRKQQQEKEKHEEKEEENMKGESDKGRREQATREVTEMSIKELRALIRSAGLEYDDCLEMCDLRDRAREAQAIAAEMPGLDKASAASSDATREKDSTPANKIEASSVKEGQNDKDIELMQNYGATAEEREQLLAELPELNGLQKEAFRAFLESMSEGELKDAAPPSELQLNEMLKSYREETAQLLHNAAYVEMNEEQMEKVTHRMRELKELQELAKELLQLTKAEEFAKRLAAAQKKHRGGIHTNGKVQASSDTADSVVDTAASAVAELAFTKEVKSFLKCQVCTPGAAEESGRTHRRPSTHQAMGSDDNSPIGGGDSEVNASAESEAPKDHAPAQYPKSKINNKGKKKKKKKK